MIMRGTYGKPDRLYGFDAVSNSANQPIQQVNLIDSNEHTKCGTQVIFTWHIHDYNQSLWLQHKAGIYLTVKKRKCAQKVRIKQTHN